RERGWQADPGHRALSDLPAGSEEVLPGERSGREARTVRARETGAGLCPRPATGGRRQVHGTPRARGLVSARFDICRAGEETDFTTDSGRCRVDRGDEDDLSGVQ